MEREVIDIDIEKTYLYIKRNKLSYLVLDLGYPLQCKSFPSENEWKLLLATGDLQDED